MKFSSLLYLWAYSKHTAQRVERPSLRCRGQNLDSSAIRNLELQKQQNHKEGEPQNKLPKSLCEDCITQTQGKPPGNQAEKAAARSQKMATHSSILAWRIPRTEEPGGLPSMGSHRVGHDWSDLAAAEAKKTEQRH